MNASVQPGRSHAIGAWIVICCLLISIAGCVPAPTVVPPTEIAVTATPVPPSPTPIPPTATPPPPTATAAPPTATSIPPTVDAGAADGHA